MNIRKMDERLLKAVRDLCPSRPQERVTFKVAGMEDVTLTYETRRQVEAELKRRGGARRARR